MFRGLIFFFCLCALNEAYALDLSHEGIYRATKQACLALPSANNFVGTTAFGEAYGGRFPSLEFNEIIFHIRTQSSKTSLESLDFKSQSSFGHHVLESAAFKAALLECYPENSRAFRFFYEAIARADRAGKIDAIVWVVLITKGVGAIFSETALMLSRFFKFEKMVVSRWIDISLIATMLRGSTAEKKEDEEVKINLATDIKPIKPVDFDRSLSLLLSESKIECARLEAELQSVKSNQRQQELQRKLVICYRLVESLQVVNRQ